MNEETHSQLYFRMSEKTQEYNGMAVGSTEQLLACSFDIYGRRSTVASREVEDEGFLSRNDFVHTGE